MKLKYFMFASIMSLGFAQGSLAAPTDTVLEPIPSVTISMQRMLRSIDGQYFLSLYAGKWNPHGTLFNLQTQKGVSFEGLQKGNQINLKSFDPEVGDAANGLYQIDAHLNANTGYMTATLADRSQHSSVFLNFEPAVKVENRPAFIFKFYGKTDPETHATLIQRVDVINKLNNQKIQQLDGFSAFSYSVDYKDINFDGYFDLVLGDASNQQKVEDNRYIYWIYNPKTKQFQHSPQLDRIKGFAHLDGVNQQINFGEGRIYQVENGLLKALP